VARLGAVWRGKAWYGEDHLCPLIGGAYLPTYVRFSTALAIHERQARRGLARRGRAWRGSAGLGAARLGEARRGVARRGMVRRGEARSGEARLGAAWFGEVRSCR
jgi:hypothetical protein